MLPFSVHECTVSIRPKGYTDNPKTIGEKLLKRRVDLRMTRTKIAKLLGVKYGAIFDWERGSRVPGEIHMQNVEEFIQQKGT